MSFEAVRDYFKSLGLEDRLLEFQTSSATVAEAAKTLGCEEKQIAKTLSFSVNDAPILIVAAGDAKVDNKKFKNQFATKAKMVPAEQVEALIGHPPGGVCPFALRSEVAVFLDVSLRRFEKIYPAAGTGRSAVVLTPGELESVSNALAWIDVCKDWESCACSVQAPGPSEKLSAVAAKTPEDGSEDESVNELAGESADESAIESANESANVSANESANESVNESAEKSKKETTGHAR